MDLSRFSRSEMLIGEESGEKLSRCHVAVFGLGGVGSWCAEALCRSGVGTLRLPISTASYTPSLQRSA